MADDETIWDRIKREMDSRGWVQADLAKAAKIPAANVSRWANKKMAPERDSLELVAKALGVSVDALMGLERLSGAERRLLNFYRDPELRDAIDEHIQRLLRFRGGRGSAKSENDGKNGSAR